MTGKVEWIGIRPERKVPLISKESVNVDVKTGIEGDHPAAAHRQVTIISKEQLEDVRIALNASSIDTASTRRNIMISGIDFVGLENARLQLGGVLLEITGPCHPCKRMDENFGEGGRNAMENLSGWTTRVLESGIISVGDHVTAHVVTATASQEH
jgi:MOSC domain-containing protein YiiM